MKFDLLLDSNLTEDTTHRHLLSLIGKLSVQNTTTHPTLMVSPFNQTNLTSATTSSPPSTTFQTNASLFPSTPPPPDPFSLHLLMWEFSHLQLPCLLISVPYILLLMGGGELFYRIISANVIPGLFKSLVLDFLCAGEAAAVSWELITIFHAYGQAVWAVASVSCIVAKLYRYRPDAVSCPYTHVQSCLKGYIDARTAAARILAQFMGGSLFFRWEGYMWDLGLTPIHIGRSYRMGYGRCYSWLSEETWVGFLYELIGSFVCNSLSAIIFDFELCPGVNLHKRIVASATSTVLIVLVAFHHTGGFFQPLLAFARTFGCLGVLKEVTILDHIVVYWMGASLGAVVAMYMEPCGKKIIKRIPWCRTKIGYSTAIIKDTPAVVVDLQDPLIKPNNKIMDNVKEHTT